MGKTTVAVMVVEKAFSREAGTYRFDRALLLSVNQLDYVPGVGAVRGLNHESVTDPGQVNFRHATEQRFRAGIAQFFSRDERSFQLFVLRLELSNTDCFLTAAGDQGKHNIPHVFCHLPGVWMQKLTANQPARSGPWLRLQQTGENSAETNRKQKNALGAAVPRLSASYLVRSVRWSESTFTTNLTDSSCERHPAHAPSSRAMIEQSWLCIVRYVHMHVHEMCACISPRKRSVSTVRF